MPPWEQEPESIFPHLDFAGKGRGQPAGVAKDPSLHTWKGAPRAGERERGGVGVESLNFKVVTHVAVARAH